MTDSPDYEPGEISRATVVRVSSADLTREDVIILVLGLAGSGKSTFIQRATVDRFEDNVSHDLRSRSKPVAAVRITYPHGVAPIVLVDTPGLDDTDEHNLKIISDIAQWLRPKGIQRLIVSGVIYLHNVSQSCASDAPLRRLLLLQNIFSEFFFGITLLTTTMWPGGFDWESEEENFIRTYWEQVYPGDRDVKRFTDTSSAWEILNHLIRRSAIVWDRLFPEITVMAAQRIASLQRRDPGAVTEIEAVEAKDLAGDDMVLVVLGPTGVGKSTIIETVAGKNCVQVGHNLTSSTNEIKALRIKFPDHIHVVLVDTPGFDHTHLSNYEVIKSLVEWFGRVRQGSVNLTGVLYLQRISDNRMPNSPFNIGMLQHLCGDYLSKNVVLTTTMWPRKDAKNFNEISRVYTEREGNLKNDFWADMIKGGSSVWRFENSAESVWNIINHLISVDTERRWATTRAKLIEEGKKLVTTDNGHEILKNLLKKLSELLAQIDGGIDEGTDGVKKGVDEFQHLRNQALKEICQLQLDPSTFDFLRRLIAFISRIIM